MTSLKGDFAFGGGADASVVAPLPSGVVARLMILYGDDVRMLAILHEHEFCDIACYGAVAMMARFVDMRFLSSVPYNTP